MGVVEQWSGKHLLEHTQNLSYKVQRFISTMILLLLYLISLFGSNNAIPMSFIVQAPGHGIVKRQTSDAKDVKITNMTIMSDIQFRYSRTVVESYMKNFGPEAQSAVFKLVLPDSAFISNFSMVVKEKEYVAQVKSKEEAKKEFSEQVDAGNFAGLVEKETRDANLFQIKTNVEGGGKVLFRLTYDELLERKQGLYEQSLHVQPGQIVDQFTILVAINESLPLTKVYVPELKDSNEIDFEQEEISSTVGKITRDVDGDPSKAAIQLDISEEYQKSFGEKGVQGEFLIQYDVDRQNQTSEIQVIDGYFVHFFTPDDLQVLPKHIIFVLDVSGSMWGEKISQLKDAMFTILDEMTGQDYFDIITFSSTAKQWKSERLEESNSYQATEANKKLGIDFIVDLEASGGTNIYEAFEEAIQLGITVKKDELLDPSIQTMILFMTDGQPTEGETNRDVIRNHTRQINMDSKFPIFSLAFGRGADFDLISDISTDADALAQQIYEGSDAALQLEDFYQRIASPLLANLKINYVGDVVDEESISDSSLPTLFRGSEFIVAGKLLQPSANTDENETFSIEMTGTGAEQFTEKRTICLRREHHDDVWPLPALVYDGCYHPPPPSPRSDAQNFLKSLYAFLNIKQLLIKEDTQSKEKALKMSLENNFVTDLTSLIVTEEEVKAEAYIGPAAHSAFDRYPFLSTSSVSFRQSARPVYGYGIGYSAYSAQAPVDYYIYTTAPAVDYQYDYAESDEEEADLNAPTTVSDVEPCEGNLTLFSKTYNRGERLDLFETADSLGDFNDRSVSAVIDGTCCWTLFKEENFAGEEIILVPGSLYTGVTSLGALRRSVKAARKQNC